MAKTRKRRIADCLFRFFTNDVVLSIAIILSVVSIFLSGYESLGGVFLGIDGIFTLFFLCEVLVKIHCVSPAPGRTTWREKFRYYWFGKYDIEKRNERRAGKGLNSEDALINEYRYRQYQKEKEKKGTERTRVIYQLKKCCFLGSNM